jgi:hypothetical protein
MKGMWTVLTWLWASSACVLLAASQSTDGECAGESFTFTTTLIIGLNGNALEATPEVFEALEDILTQAYNNAAGCETPGAFVKVTETRVILDVTDAEGNVISDPPSDRLVVEFDVMCKGCNGVAFSNVGRRLAGQNYLNNVFQGGPNRIQRDSRAGRERQTPGKGMWSKAMSSKGMMSGKGMSNKNMSSKSMKPGKGMSGMSGKGMKPSKGILSKGRPSRSRPFKGKGNTRSPPGPSPTVPSPTDPSPTESAQPSEPPSAQPSAPPSALQECDCDLPMIETYLLECNELIIERAGTPSFTSLTGGSLLSIPDGLGSGGGSGAPSQFTTFTRLSIGCAEGISCTSDSDLALLASGIASVYNRLNAFSLDLCDPDGRVVTNVVAIETTADASSVDSDRRGRRLQLDLFSVVFQITATYRGGESSTVIFGDHTPIGSRRQLVDISTVCANGQNPVAIGCPSTEAFSEALEEWVADRQEDDDLLSLTTFDAVEESSATTAAPTVSPSTQPSSQPSFDFDILYINDFESPNTAVVRNRSPCTMLSSTPVNTHYGRPENLFSQTNTVETFLLEGSTFPPTGDTYVDPDGRGGQFAIGMLGSSDLVSLGFDLQGRRFVQISLDFSPIAITCRPLFPNVDATFRLSLIDDPNGNVPVSGRILDSVDVFAPAGPNATTFAWVRHTVVLDAQLATNGLIAINWDLIGVYAVFDNLEIIAFDGTDPTDESVPPS